MSTRPRDWDPLAGSDPLPGDPHEVTASARRYRDTASLLQDQAARLRRMAADPTQEAQSWSAFASKAPGVASQLERAQGRYEEAAQALHAYSDDLAAAQAQGDQALARAKEADARRRRAAQALSAASAAYRSAWAQYALDAANPLVDAASPPDDGAVRRAQADLDDAERDLEAARRQLERAVDARDRAAERAARSIRAVAEHDGLNDSRWDRVRAAASDGWSAATSTLGDLRDGVARGLDAAGDALDAAGDAIGDAWDRTTDYVSDNWVGWVENVTTAAGWVATVAGVAALAVGWIPVVGQAAAAVLGTIALAASVVSLAGNFTLWATGNGSWTKMVVDVIGIATVGVGRVLAKGTQASYVAARASARQSARTVITTGTGGGTSPKAVANHVNRLTGGKAGAATPSALGGRPTGWRPTWDEFSSAYRPSEIRADIATAPTRGQAWDAVKDTASAARGGLDDLGTHVATRGSGLEAEVLRAGRVDRQALLDAGADMSRYDDLMRDARRQFGTYAVTTVGGIGVDVSDKRGWLDPLHDATRSGR